MAQKSQQPHSSPGKTVETVRTLALPVAEEYGVLLWDVRFLKEGADWFLRIYIDREDAPVSIDDCVNVSRKLSDLLDEADPIAQSYCLEVSSPGAERELTRPEHFVRFAGSEIVVRLYHAIDGVREFTGILHGTDENGTLQLEIADGSILSFEKKQISAVHVPDNWDDTAD